MTAREKGLADGYRQALRECAIDLNAQRVTIGHPGHRCNGTFGTVDRTGLAVSKATTMRRRVARAW